MKTRQVRHSFIKAAPLVVAVTFGGFASLCAYAQANPFTLSSPDLAGGTFDNKFVLNGFGCSGGNVSPALEWSNVPAGTKSLSLQIHDLGIPVDRDR